MARLEARGPARKKGCPQKLRSAILSSRCTPSPHGRNPRALIIRILSCLGCGTVRIDDHYPNSLFPFPPSYK